MPINTTWLYHNKIKIRANCQTQEPTKRPNQFTNECIQAAKQKNIALICTTDLFYITQHLKTHLDITFKTKCRQIILSTKGLVSFNSLFNKIT